MEELFCCLAGICCPPALRRQKAIKHYVSLGLNAAEAERVADDTLARIDAFLATGMGAMLKQVFAHGQSHK